MNLSVAIGLALLVRVEEPTLHIVSARDGKPVADAVVELWTEDGVEPMRVAMRLAVVRTSPDGSAAYSYTPQGIRTDLARISKPGFASRTTSTSELSDGVELYPAAPLTGRVVDLQGQPVAGALVRTRETCPHAVPAAETFTDREGRFTLTDCPADEQMAELEVLPTNHIPLGAIQIEALRRLQARDGTFDVHVVERAPLWVRVLDGAGSPMAGRRLVCDERPRSATWTDKNGYALLPPQKTWDAPLSLVDGIGRSSLPIGCVPRTGSFTVRPLEHQRAVGPGKLTVDVRIPSGSTTMPRVAVIDALGSTFERKEIEGLASGRATILVGQDFSPWQELVLLANIVDGATTVIASPHASPAVRVLLPEWATKDCWATLLVQAGSTGFFMDLECPIEALVHVPSGEEIVVLATSALGEVRRVAHAPLQAGVTEIDLRTPASLVRLGVPAPAEER